MRVMILVIAISSAVGCASVRSVDDGRLYRSGQLTQHQLEEVVRDKGIRTVINLRGADPDRRWYQEQQEVCQRLGVRQIDLAMDERAPDRQEVTALLDAYRDAPRPILVHSWSSAGSVGLASGLYRTTVMGESSEVARKELSPWMTFRLPWSRGSAHDQFLSEWQGERAFHESYQLADRRDLPTPTFGEAPATPFHPSGEFRPMRDGDQFPPPAIDQFKADVAAAPRPTVAPTRDVVPVVWLGSPEPASEARARSTTLR